MVMFVIFGLLFVATFLHLAKVALRYATFRFHYQEVVLADPMQDFDLLIAEEKYRFHDEYDDGIPVLCVFGVVTLASYLLTLPFNFL